MVGDWRPLVRGQWSVVSRRRSVVRGRGDAMNIRELMLANLSILLAAQSGYSAALTLYAWEDGEKLEKNRVPTSFDPPRTRFTLLLPARHEEEVIQDTIQRMVDLKYPHELVQILVVIEAGDHGTIAEVNARLDMLRAQGIGHV